MRQTNWSQSRLTLRNLCERFLKTIQHQKPKTVERKEAIIRRIVEDWPTGSDTQIGKIKSSEVDLWLSHYGFGPASRNLYVSCVKELFRLAMRDRVVAASPAEHLKSVKRATPIRFTPSSEQFKAIIADVRAQRFNAEASASADFLEFLGLAGLGQAEAASLRCEDIDFQAGHIITFRHKTSTGFAVPIFPQLKPLLERLCDGKSNGEWIFTIRDAKKALAGACRRLHLFLLASVRFAACSSRARLS